MPNYILSRTSPPEHIYERKINLGYGIKVDTSDAPTTKPNEKKNDVKSTMDVAKPVATFADGSALAQAATPTTEAQPKPKRKRKPKAETKEG